MTYNPSLHHRQSIRMKKYDYASEGAYFITICTHNKEMILDSNPIREIILKIWKELPGQFSNLRLDEFVVMPNHVHFIIWLVRALLAAPSNTNSASLTNCMKSEGSASGAPTVGNVIRAFKSISAIAINRYLGRKGIPVWQRNYYDRIIRDDRELFLTRQYIIDNPKNWAMDSENPK